MPATQPSDAQLDLQNQEGLSDLSGLCMPTSAQQLCAQTSRCTQYQGKNTSDAICHHATGYWSSSELLLATPQHAWKTTAVQLKGAALPHFVHGNTARFFKSFTPGRMKSRFPSQRTKIQIPDNSHSLAHECGRNIAIRLAKNSKAPHDKHGGSKTFDGN